MLTAAGSEWMVLPDLMVSKSLCALDQVFIEYHDSTWGPLSAQHKSGDTIDQTGRHLMGGLISSIRSRLQGVIDRSPCPVRVVDLDDESFVHDGQPWPKRGSICPRPIDWEVGMEGS